MTPNNQPLPFHSNTPAELPWTAFQALGWVLLGFILMPAFLASLLNQVMVLPASVRPVLSFSLPVVSWTLLLLFIGRSLGLRLLWDTLGLKGAQSAGFYFISGVGCYGLMLLTGFVMGLLAQWFGWPVVLPDAMVPPGQRWLVAFFAVITAPFIEEIAFRGMLQPALARKLPVIFAVVLTALVFTAFHGMYYQHPIAMVYVFLLGILLGWVREQSQSLWPCILAHFLNNLTAAFLVQ